jgi:hypothetical protein
MRTTVVLTVAAGLLAGDRGGKNCSLLRNGVADSGGLPGRATMSRCHAVAPIRGDHQYGGEKHHDPFRP